MAANVIKLLDNVIKRCNLNIALINISSNVGRIDEHRDFLCTLPTMSQLARNDRAQHPNDLRSTCENTSLQVVLLLISAIAMLLLLLTPNEILKKTENRVLLSISEYCPLTVPFRTP